MFRCAAYKRGINIKKTLQKRRVMESRMENRCPAPMVADGEKQKIGVNRWNGRTAFFTNPPTSNPFALNQLFDTQKSRVLSVRIKNQTEEDIFKKT